MQRFSTKARERLWNRCVTDAGHCICPHCELPVYGYEKWHECHVGTPACHGGQETLIGHAACNLADNNKNVTPMAAKTKRVRQKFIGAFQTKHKMPCGRQSRYKKTMDGKVVLR